MPQGREGVERRKRPHYKAHPVYGGTDPAHSSDCTQMTRYWVCVPACRWLCVDHGLCLSLLLPGELTCIFIMRCRPGAEGCGAGFLLGAPTVSETFQVPVAVTSWCEPQATWNSTVSVLGLKCRCVLLGHRDFINGSWLGCIWFPFFKMNFNFVIVSFISIWHQI